MTNTCFATFDQLAHTFSKLLHKPVHVVDTPSITFIHWHVLSRMFTHIHARPRAFTLASAKVERKNAYV